VLFGGVSEHHGVCRYCREQPFIEAKGMCNKCEAALIAEDQEMMKQEMMERVTKGKTS
jgi:hypothetical protein